MTDPSLPCFLPHFRNSSKFFGWPSSSVTFTVAALAFVLALPPHLAAQAESSSRVSPPIALVQPAGPNAAAPPVIITLQDALDQAKKTSAEFSSALTDAQLAHEDRVQAKAGLLPAFSSTTQYLGTQGNGKLPSGRYVTNDGVHVYREWAVGHEEINGGVILRTPYKRAAAAEAIAKAKAEIAWRGLNVTVTKTYYDLIVSQRKYATAQQALQQAQRFLDITKAQESHGQAAHSDVVKADLQFQQQKQAFDEAELAMEEARLNLAVLLFPVLNENFSVVDDLDSAHALPQWNEVQEMAARENPDMRVAMEALHQAKFDVTAAKTAFWPTLVIDADYGIEANHFALNSHVTANPEAGRLPNLGYFITAGISFPVWDWGALRSKLHQAQFKKTQAETELSQAQRTMMSKLYSSYDEALVARSAIDTLRHAADLANESLRLINLRYQAGESTVLEVVDAGNTLTQARNAYDDAQARYRLALATLQTLTGSF